MCLCCTHRHAGVWPCRIMTPESVVKFFEAFPRVYIPDQNGRETNCVVEVGHRRHLVA